MWVSTSWQNKGVTYETNVERSCAISVMVFKLWDLSQKATTKFPEEFTH